MSLIWAILSTKLDREYFKRVYNRWHDVNLGADE